MVVLDSVLLRLFYNFATKLSILLKCISKGDRVSFVHTQFYRFYLGWFCLHRVQSGAISQKSSFAEERFQSKGISFANSSISVGLVCRGPWLQPLQGAQSKQSLCQLKASLCWSYPFLLVFFVTTSVKVHCWFLGLLVSWIFLSHVTLQSKIQHSMFLCV